MLRIIGIEVTYRACRRRGADRLKIEWRDIEGVFTAGLPLRYKGGEFSWYTGRELG